MSDEDKIDLQHLQTAPLRHMAPSYQKLPIWQSRLHLWIRSYSKKLPEEGLELYLEKIERNSVECFESDPLEPYIGREETGICFGLYAIV